MKCKLTAAPLLFLVAALGIHQANAQTSVGNRITGGARIELIDHTDAVPLMPKPDEVTIHSFAVATDRVTVDDSLAARLRRRRLLWSGADDDSTPQILAQHVQAAFAKALAAELATHGIAATNAAANTAVVPADQTRPRLMVDGEFTTIDEGNKDKRVMIGIGRGASEIKAHVIVSATIAGRSTTVLEFDTDSDSGKMPGALPTLGGGSLIVGTGLGVAGDTGATSVVDASRLGKLVAEQIDAFMAKQQTPANSAVGAAGPAGKTPSAS